MLEIYAVRTLEEKGGVEKGLMDGISGAQLEVACHYMYTSFQLLGFEIVLFARVL